MLKKVDYRAAEYLYDKLEPLTRIEIINRTPNDQLIAMVASMISIIDHRHTNQKTGIAMEKGGRTEKWFEFLSTTGFEEYTLFSVEKTMKMLGYHESWQEFSPLSFIRERWYSLKKKYDDKAFVLMRSGLISGEFCCFDNHAKILFDADLKNMEFTVHHQKMLGHPSYFFIMNMPTLHIILTLLKERDFPLVMF